MGDRSGNKLYIGGLSFDTTTQSLEEHFAQYGEIAEAIVMMDKTTNRSRGFGFVTYRDATAMDKALSACNIVDGREVSCKPSVPLGEADRDFKPAGGGSVYNVVKVFVGGLPGSCDTEKLMEYFAQFGEIKDAVVMMDNATQRHRGFGYVTFRDATSVEAAIANYPDNKIDGKWVEVKRCIPQDQMRNAPGGGGGGGGKARGRDRSPPRNNSVSSMAAPGGCGYGGCPYGNYGPYGAYGAYPPPPAMYPGYYGMYPGVPPHYGAYGAYPPPGYPAPPGGDGNGLPPGGYPDPYGGAGGYRAAAPGSGDSNRSAPY